MKKVHLMITILFSIVTLLGLQAQSLQAPTFNAKERGSIEKLLKGSVYSPVFSEKGEVLIVTEQSIQNVKALKGGGFTVGGPSVAKNETIHAGWIHKESEALLNSMKSSLGRERFQQLDALLSQKDL